MAYAGMQVKIPLGDFGLLTDMSPGSLPLGALIEARNVVLNNGTVQKAPGATRYNPSYQLDGEIVALYDWFPDPFTQRMIAVTDAGKIYKDIGDRTFSLGVPINTGYPAFTPRSQFVPGGNETTGESRKLFYFSDGLTQVQVLDGDGSAFAEINEPASDWSGRFPRVGVIHRNRLWAFMGQRAYASTTGDHEDFVDASVLTQEIYSGEGGDIIGAYVFKGRLFCFKEGLFIYFLDDSDVSSTNWYWRKLASNFGLASPNSLVNALDDLLSGNATGSITSYKAADTLGDIESADLLRASGIERYLRATTHPIGIPNMHALYDEELKQIYFTYRSTYTNTNDMLLNIDYNRGAPRITYLQKGSPTCLAIRKNINSISVPMYGGADGYVYMMNAEDRLEGAVSYTGVFQTAFHDFKEADPKLGQCMKQFDHIWIEYVPEADADLSIDVFIDGRFVETVTTRLELADEELGSFLLGTDRLAQYTTVTNPVPIAGMGYRISFRCYNSGSNESFQIASIGVGFRPTHEGVTLF